MGQTIGSLAVSLLQLAVVITTRPLHQINLGRQLDSNRKFSPFHCACLPDSQGGAKVGADRVSFEKRRVQRRQIVLSEAAGRGSGDLVRRFFLLCCQQRVVPERICAAVPRIANNQLGNGCGALPNSVPIIAVCTGGVRCECLQIVDSG